MEARRAAALLALAACVACSQAAPTASNQTALDLYEGAPEGCYYNFQHYGEGDRIMTNEPCLNCTCHNRMLMCYLRVCPFTKPIGQDCTVEKRADQCCPIVTCPDVPVDLLTSTSTTSPAEYGATGVGHQDKYGCSINGRYLPEGSKVPSTPNKPCEHCYCIRNMTTCVMQECTLHVDGCVPIYHKDVCCPVRYSCDHSEDDIKLLDDMTTTVRPTPGFLLTTTMSSPVTQVSQDCVHDDQIFADGALIKTEKACEHCYCMKGDIVCVVQECGTPMENEGKNCTSLPPREGQCCPDTYICEGDELPTEQTAELTTEEILRSTSITPPRKGTEGSGYRNEPDEPYTDLPIFETVDMEGSGEDQSTLSIDQSESVTPEKPTPDFADEMFLTTAKQFESKPTSATEIDTMVTKSDTSDAEITSSHETDKDAVTESIKSNDDEESKTVAQNEVTETTYIDSHDNKVTEKPLLTTLSELISSTLGENLIPVEDKTDKTTESSFRKEDDATALPELITQKTNDGLTTKSEYHEQKETKEDVVPTTAASVIPDEEDDKKTQSLVTTTEIVMAAETDKEITDKVDTYGSSTTMRTEILGETTVNPTENEVDEDLLPIVSPGRIPGEGDCLLNGITYKNTTDVPSTNKCHTGCRCVSSIIKCDPIICSPPPPEYANMNNCEPIYDSAESCCPTYICDHSKEGTLPESHSQMSGTESPKPIKSNECVGDECLTDEDKHTLSPIQSEPCTAENCVLPEKQPVLPECGKDGCLDTEPVVPEHPVKCDKETGCQVTAGTPCEGDHCKDFITTEPDSTIASPENQDNIIEKECSNDSCRRKEIPQDTIKLPSSCVGTECETETQTDLITSDLTSEVPIVAEEVTKTSQEPTTMTSISQTTRAEEKLTTLEEKSTSQFDITSTRKTEVEIQEVTTESIQNNEEVSGLGITREPATYVTEHPEIDGTPDDSFVSAFDSTTLGDIEKEHLTTSDDIKAPESTISEETPEVQQTVSDITQDFTSSPQTSKVEESQGITKSEEQEEKQTTMPLESLGTSAQTEKTFALDKSKGTIDVDDETTYTTESMIKKETDQQYHDKISTAQDNDYSTETPKLSKGDDDTTPELIKEYSTSLPQSQGIEEKTTEAAVDFTEKATTNLLDDSSAIIGKDESTTTVSDISLITTGQESVTEIVKDAENDVHSTEQSPEHTIDDESTQVYEKTPAVQHDMSSVAPDSHKYEEDVQKTPEIVYTTVNPMLDKKETTKEEQTEIPVTDNVVINEISHPSDEMESLNGRATEGPEVYDHDGLHTVTQDADLYTTRLTEAVTSSDEQYSVSVSTEKTRHTTEKGFEHDIETETPSQQDVELVKVVTESIATKPERGDGITEDDLIDDKNNMFTTNVFNEITTVRIDGTEPTFKEEAEEQKEGQRPTDEKVHTADQITSTETNKHITDVDNEIPSVTLPESHIAQSDSTESLSLVTEYTIPEQHEAELTTTSPYSSERDTTEDAEASGDINKQPEAQDDKDEQHTSDTTSKLSEEITTEKQNLPSSITTVLPGTTENILHTTLIEEHIATESPSPQVTENIGQESLPTRRVADHGTEVTVSLSEETTTKLDGLSGAITDTPDLTTKVNELPEEEEKVTISSHGTDVYEDNKTTKTDFISEEELKQKTTVIPQAVITEQLFTNAVTQKDSEETSIDETQPTEVPEKLTSKSIVSEHEAVTEKLSTSDLIESTEEPEKTTAGQYYTESIIENVTAEDKDKSTGMPDVITSSKLETETPESTQSFQDISRTTEFSDSHVTEKVHTHLEKTTIKTSETNVDLDENTINIEDLDITEVTDSPVKVTETYDIQKQTLLPEKLATTQEESLPQETSSPVIQYSEKTTESTETLGYTEQISTESSGYPSGPTEIPAVQDDKVSSDKTQEEMTLPELITESVMITTESSNAEENIKDIETTDEKTTEEPLVKIEDAEKEIGFTTYKPIIQDHVTEKLPESNIFEDKETEKPLLSVDDVEKDVDFITDTPMILEHVTEGETGSHIFEEKIPEEPIKIDDAEKDLDFTTDKDVILEHVTKDLPESHVLGGAEETTLAEETPTKQPITELPEFVTDSIKEVDNGDSQEHMITAKPEISTLDSATGISDHKETATAPSEVFIPVETSSYLPDKDIETEEDTTVSDEKFPVTESKPDEGTVITESPEQQTTSKSSEDFGKVDITEATESSISESGSKTSGTTPSTHTVPTYTSQETESEKPTIDELHILSTISSENDKLEGTTLKTIHEETTEIIEPSTVKETSIKTESQETTLDSGLDTVKVSMDEEDKTIAYTPEQYTEMPEQTFTEVQKSPSPSSESDIAVTEMLDIVTHSPEKYTTIIEEEPTFTDKKHEHLTTIAESLITQKVETETALPITLSTQRTTQEIETSEHITEGQSSATKAPELHEYTTESDDIATPTLIEHTVSKETVETELPVTVVTPRDQYTEEIHHEVTSETKETKPDYTTEKIEISTKSDTEAATPVDTESSLLESKPTSDSSAHPQHTEETSEQMDEHSETTPYLVELEEHTHKGVDETTPDEYHEDTTSTVKPEILYPEKLHEETTTEKQDVEESPEITTEQKIDEPLRITTEKQGIDETTIKEAVETSTSAASEIDLGTPETIHEISTELPIHNDKITTLSPVPVEIESDVTKVSTVSYDKDKTTTSPAVTTTSYEEPETPKQEEHATAMEKENESVPVKPTDAIPALPETTAPEEEFIPAVTQGTTSKTIEDITTISPTQSHKFTKPEEKPIESLPSTASPELPKPGLNDILPTDEVPPTDEDSHFPPTGSSGYGQEPDYGEEDQAFGPGTCRYGGKVYVSAQQIPRDDPCDFCFCFRSDIICLQQSCPPPIHGCHEEPIQGFCCPRYECPVSMATTLNITTTTTTTTTTLPPHFLPHAYKGAAQRRGCQIKGHTYKVGEVVRASSGPCLHCTCGGDGQMKCDPKACTPEPMLRQMIAAAVSSKRRR